MGLTYAVIGVEFVSVVNTHRILGVLVASIRTEDQLQHQRYPSNRS